MSPHPATPWSAVRGAARFIVRRRLQVAIDRFCALLDAEGVGIFQAIVYVNALVGALYLFAVADGTVPQPIEDSFGATMNVIWLWLSIGPAACLVGKMLSWRDSTRYAGYWLQLAGDIAALGSFLTYVLATIETSWWGKTVWAVFIVSAIGQCILLLIVRDTRRILQVEREIRS